MIPFTTTLAGRVDAVAKGADGRLFLERGDGFDAAELFAQPFVNLPRLERLWSVALARRLRLCGEVGAALVVVIAPEAHGVHSDALPAPLRYTRPSVGDRFQALAEGMGATVVWARDALTAARGPVDVFRRDDSHWSSYGAFAAYQDVMAALPPPLSRAAVSADAVSFAWEEAMGDLGWATEAPDRRPRLRPVFDKPRARLVAEIRNERRHGLKITEVDDPALPTAVVFRDSFGAELHPFLAESFRRMVSIGSGERAYVEIIAEERPDVVILLRSERALLSGVIDWGLETWREAFPHPGGEPEAQDAELGARAALHAGDVAAAVDLGEQALSREPTPERHILSGRAHLAAGRTAEAIVDLEAALASSPGRWTALLHLGCAHMAAADLGAARNVFAEACAAAPWHPAGFEHFGYACLQAGDAATAIAPLRTAVRLGPETAGPHLWLVDALQAVGGLPAAADAARAGLHVCPDDPLLQGRVETLDRPAH